MLRMGFILWDYVRKPSNNEFGFECKDLKDAF